MIYTIVSVHGLHPPLPERYPAAGAEERRQARQQGGVQGVQEGGGKTCHDTDPISPNIPVPLAPGAAAPQPLQGAARLPQVLPAVRVAHIQQGRGSGGRDYAHQVNTGRRWVL